MGLVFPGAASPVPADWFTGEVVCPLGKVLQTGLFHTWRAYRVLHFDRGHLVRTERRGNGEGVRQWRRAEKVSKALQAYRANRNDRKALKVLQEDRLRAERQALGISEGISRAQKD